ncbi:MAG: NUDIX domain-containing protein [Candidatus Saccharimonadales bacterium]
MANITFVDDNDDIIGYGTRKEAIAKDLAHRIARVFVFNSSGQMLIQKRSSRVQLPGKWDQSAAGHVDEGEDYLTAAAREANEEIGLKGAPLKLVGKFYTVENEGTTTMKRFNTLYTVVHDGYLKQDDNEVSEVKWIELDELKEWMDKNPAEFTQGFIKTFHYYLNK